MEKTTRNREATTQRILAAFEEVLAQGGLQAVTIHELAQRAGVSGALVYRYFGGLEGLLAYYIQGGGVYPVLAQSTLDQLRPETADDFSRLWYRQLTQLGRQFRLNKANRELLLAQAHEPDALAELASQQQDEALRRFIDQLSFGHPADTQAIAAVTIGALVYLTLLAQNNRTMVGIDLRSQAGWSRIEQAIQEIYLALGQQALR